ncbi:MAG: copper amine oxidase N-terminal domain-containing protein [Firmicutes bacterium]|nr:copper amine oxidase N-terminal domain-containing protein [Bacillota bacterium]
MKKAILGLVICLAFFFAVSHAEASSLGDDGSIRLFVDKKEVYPHAPIVVKEDRVLVPLRTLAEATGAEVKWDEKTSEVTVKKAGKEIVFRIGQKEYTVQGNERSLDISPEIIGERTMLPLRAAAEALDCKVEWLGMAKIVNVFTKEWPPLHDKKPEYIKALELLFPDLKLLGPPTWGYIWLTPNEERSLFKTLSIGESTSGNENVEVLVFLESHPHVNIFISEDDWWKFKVLLKMYFPNVYSQLYDYVRSIFDRQSADWSYRAFELLMIGDRQVVINGTDGGPRLSVAISKPGKIYSDYRPSRKFP